MTDEDLLQDKEWLADFARREAAAQRNIWLWLILFSAVWTGLLVWWLT